MSKEFIRNLVAEEISSVAEYCDKFIQLEPLAHDDGNLFDDVKCAHKEFGQSDAAGSAVSGDRVGLYCYNGNFNHGCDIQHELTLLYKNLNRHDRVVVVLYNPYLRFVYKIAAKLGWKAGPAPTIFLTKLTLGNIAALACYDLLTIKTIGYLPWKIFGIGTAFNKLLSAVPLLRWSSFVCVAYLRPIKETASPTVSIIVPARNEAGNIKRCLAEIPVFETSLVELIFVEGHSTDATWDEIQSAQASHIRDGMVVHAYQQRGIGKNDAVRLGVSKAGGELVTILDADLTMPPAMLGRCFDAYRRGLADFVNGNRLVYPMEKHAMRFLNLLGNVFFAKALSMVLGINVGDSLCGTKLLTKRDYERIEKWRTDFGDLDPFGDFELLFGASVLHLGVIEIPVRYQAREYGETNIDRFSHGAMLLKMLATGLWRIKLGFRR